MTFLFIVCLAGLGVQCANSQNAQNKNSLYGTLGMIPGSLATGTLNYERWLSNIANHKNRHLTLRGGYGVWATWGAEGNSYILSINRLSGAKKSYFDTGLGIALLVDKWIEEVPSTQPDGTVTYSVDHMSRNLWYPAIHAGYRYSTNHFLFRTGLSWPESLYLSLGFSI